MSAPQLPTPAVLSKPRPPQTLWGRAWRSWWRKQSPVQQDRVATLAPLAAVLLFLAAISASFVYLRFEEMDREQEAVKRDVEYAQQRLRLRLLERQEQLMRLAHDVSNQEVDTEEFIAQAESLVGQYPELLGVSWIDARRKVRAAYASPSAPESALYPTGQSLPAGETQNTFDLAHDIRQPVYSNPVNHADAAATLQLQVPLAAQGKFAGVIVGEYAIDGLLRFGIPPELGGKYAVSLLSDDGKLLAGNVTPAKTPVARLLPWANRATEYEVPISPVGNGLVLRAQGYRTSLGLIGNGLFWLVSALSLLTAWALLGTWRHTRRRMQAQQALLSETNFRRAMENSMLTGMRALDMQGRITYVNAAFCQMTGWSDTELVGHTAPFPYWPETDIEILTARLEDELAGRTTVGGFQVRVKRKDGHIFDARLYVSPLIDAAGKQTGWMTSMTDITEPNRIRQQLSESYERFTTVLEALDASVSVAPLGSTELLFANKLYRQWFQSDTAGHLQLVAQAGLPAPTLDEAADDVDTMAGLPIGQLTAAVAENAEIFVPNLGKWIEVRSRYLSWVDGRLAQMVIATDITPRRQAEDLSAHQAERAQSASRLITMGEMASSVAHELNQPLTAINNYCNGMVSRIQAGNLREEDLLAALDKTARQAQRAGQIIQRIRSFVKRSEPNRTQSDVGSMISEAVELANIELRRRNVRLSYYLAGHLPHLLVDPILIEQVLVNLLKNAAESVDLAERPTAQRNVDLHVAPRQVDGQDVLDFVVTDTGKGLAPEVMQRLYEAFFSTKAEGMGIGLNLCRSIIESHQGRISAENIYNGDAIAGCRFSFWLPVPPAPKFAANDFVVSQFDPSPE